MATQVSEMTTEAMRAEIQDATPERAVELANEIARRTMAARPTKPARRANWRCPNPQDCGDPTCTGNCGY